MVGAEEGEAMKKNWLRGLLLGVSLALLLGGGVALAQSMSIEPYCNVCCDKYEEPWGCDGWAVETTGWQQWENLNVKITSSGPAGIWDLYLGKTDDAGAYFFDLYLMCADCVMYTSTGLGGAIEWLPLCDDWAAGDYGEWSIEVTSDEPTGGTPGSALGHFLFAEDPSDCQVEEFVPEPGTIMLLGSGLAGLAGYATLRWRARE